MQFDYVIVGGGSAGCVLANRLTEDPNVRVCLLEAGGGGNSIFVRMPALVVAMLPGKPLKMNNWTFETVPQKGLNGRKGYQPRGKALGGSSAINAMLYVRGQREDYDERANLGCEGWDWDSVLPYFVKSENNERGSDDAHGAAGPLQVSDQRESRPSPAISWRRQNSCKSASGMTSTRATTKASAFTRSTSSTTRPRMASGVRPRRPICFRSWIART